MLPLPTFPQDARLSAKMALQGKALRVHLDLRKYETSENLGQALNLSEPQCLQDNHIFLTELGT